VAPVLPVSPVLPVAPVPPQVAAPPERLVTTAEVLEAPEPAPAPLPEIAFALDGLAPAKSAPAVEPLETFELPELGSAGAAAAVTPVMDFGSDESDAAIDFVPGVEPAAQRDLEAERLEAERLEAERLEAERLEAEWLEAQRLEAERLESLAIGCVGAVIFGIGNGIGLVCNVTLIQQTVSDDRRGQIFAVLGSLVQTFTLIGTLAAGPITEILGPRLTWGLSAALLVVGYVNAVLVTALRARRDRREGVVAPDTKLPELAPAPAGRGSPGSSFERIATLLDEIELTRRVEASREVEPGRRRRRGTRPAPPPGSERAGA